ncbi:Mucin-associated surface protein (MASP) [Trypanosoma cruzi]|uniref:Mucin-associated surface protein (MASP), putative n=2 Tax=Trypanosoma cruzi TaxID=5693 RepID=Q4D3W5_TRYCC|nr:mucin-associated surface protein (MASP), putative [Trypanosoma cruzi]EAN87210.1 mucin-associated surface protein (MASP), putative [Trypanosoma cruzi]PWV15220.1 Mucin-associated surface protein (MASP) [Trypanosoma cruzi]|eukprot:XP_809061.1 mucin-associated surface protein (MASP) [Trypanosoma cruzi strain CL Brener]
MAMMMTGRVLLVCALCVLWCGVSVVAVPAADVSGGGDGGADVSGRQPKPPQLETTPSNIQDPKRPSANVDEPMLEVAATSLEGTGGDDVEDGDGEDEEEGQLVRKDNEGIRAQEQHDEHDRQNDQHDGEKERNANDPKSGKEGKTPGKDPAKETGLQSTPEDDSPSHLPNDARRGNTQEPRNASPPGNDDRKQDSLNVSQDAPIKFTPDTILSSSSTGGNGADNSHENQREAKNAQQASAGVKQHDAESGEKSAAPTKGEGESQLPVTADEKTSNTTIPGISVSSSAATTAVRSETSTESSRTISDLSPSSSEDDALPKNTPDGDDASHITEDVVSPIAGTPIPQQTAAQTNHTPTPDDSDSSTAAPPAGESDAATTTTPNNHDARSLNNNGNNTFTEEVDQKEATRKPKSAPESTDTAAANSEASTTAINISTNTTNKTTTGDSDSSTAVSHTTSPLLLLLVVACAAAAAVVAA